MITSGSGYLVKDIDGNEFLDAGSLNAVCGYAHPHVVQALQTQLQRLHTFDIASNSHELVGELAERIASYLSPDLSRTLFVNSGSEAFDAALFIAANHWSFRGEPRTRVVTLARGYHGATLASRGLSALPRVRQPLTPAVKATFVDLPNRAAAMREADSLPALLAAFERAIGSDASDLPMAVIVEPFLNVGGGVVLPPGFLGGLRTLCDQTGTLFVVDEIFTGYGRTGKLFACQHEWALPDILVSSKGLASGYVPIAAVTATQSIYESFAADSVIGGLRYGHTTAGHALGCAAALATLDVIEREHLVERAAELGRLLLRRMACLMGSADIVDVRGLGLVGVVEMSSVESAARLREQARHHGLLVKQQSEAVVVVPPLIVDEAGIEDIARRLLASTWS